MKKDDWKDKIKKDCEAAGTYQPFFESLIDALAGIMEMRDNALEKFVASGGNTVVAHTNKGGATNITKNPALKVVMDCEALALTYWRELGLTPAGLKKINEEGLKAKEAKGGKTALDVIRKRHGKA